MYLEGMAAEIEADREAVAGSGGDQPRQVGPGVTEHTERVDFTTMSTAAIREWTAAQPGPM